MFLFIFNETDLRFLQAESASVILSSYVVILQVTEFFEVRVVQNLLDAEFWQIVFLSIQVSGSAVLIAVLLSIPLACWISARQERSKRVLKILIHTGMAIPPVVLGLFLYLLLSRSGPLASLGWLFTSNAMIAAQTLLALPFATGILLNSLENLPKEFSEQLQTIGASPLQARWMMIREIRSGFLLAIAAALGRSLSEVGAMLMIGGNIAGHTRVMTTAIVLETSQGRFGLAIALSMFLLGFAFLLNLFILKLGNSGVVSS